MSQISDSDESEFPSFDSWLPNLTGPVEPEGSIDQVSELIPRATKSSRADSLFPPMPEGWPDIDDEDFDPRDLYQTMGGFSIKPPPELDSSKKAAHRGWQFYDLDHIQQLPTIKKLTGELIHNSLHLLYGPSGVGKSFLALDYALRASVEHEVLYCAPEGFMGYRSRIQAWQRFFGLIPSHFHLTSQHLPLMDANKLSEFVKTLGKHKIHPRLFVLDTFAWSLSPGDENSARDVQVAIEACRYLQKTFRASVLLVHHTGKVGESERGSSALRAAMDVVLQLRRQQRGFVTLMVAKSKDSRENHSRNFAFVEVIMDDDESSCVLLEGDYEDLDLMSNLEPDEDQGLYEEILEADRSLVIRAELADLGEEQVFFSQKQSPYHLTNGEYEILSYIGQHEKGLTTHQVKSKIQNIKNPYNILGKLLQRHFLSQNGRGQPYILTPKGERALEENK
jgi:hypothetical protein